MGDRFFFIYSESLEAKLEVFIYSLLIILLLCTLTPLASLVPLSAAWVPLLIFFSIGLLKDPDYKKIGLSRSSTNDRSLLYASVRAPRALLRSERCKVNS